MIKIWHKNKSIILTKKIGQGTTIHAPVWIGENVEIGNNVKIQAFAFLPEGVKIEDNVFIGPGVVFTNDKYPPSDKIGWEKTLVKEGASIGANATILPGIRIGKRSMVGAGAVVVKDVPNYEIWVGNPAIPIEYKSKFPLLKYKNKIDSGFANYICGFIDGEGCFSSYRQRDKYDRFCFAIESDYRDRPLYEEIKEKFGCGTIYERRRKSLVNKLNCHYVIYMVRNIKDIQNVIIPFFDVFKLRGLKYIKYRRWRERFLDNYPAKEINK